MTVLLIVIAAALVMLAIEYARPARPWPKVAGWWPRALAINGFQVAIVFVAGATWERWLHGPHLASLASLPRPAELVLGYLAYALWLYWAHRARHHFHLLWRWLHQLHHSPARVEILTAYYKHPLEIVIESILGAALLYLVIGVSRDAAFAITNLSGVLGLFYHWNVSTPRWLGYIVQRPESHCVHHERGVHAFNYSELPLIDVVFGTFENPARFEGTCGFGDDREQRFAALLRGEDVTEP
jgi:sterol desaturase/sphingolipid hydroxylase (fatty acid hydroxylase superfamily)